MQKKLYKQNNQRRKGNNQNEKKQTLKIKFRPTFTMNIIFIIQLRYLVYVSGHPSVF